jgi:hypothetical protein
MSEYLLFSIEELLPINKEVSPWQKSESALVYKGKKLYEYINGGAEIYYEYGFIQVITQRYINEDESLNVDIYEMNNPKAAFGIYSIQRDPKMTALNFGDDGTKFDYHVTFWQDRYCVTITGYKSNAITKKALIQLVEVISKKIKKTANEPDLLDYLPKEYILPRSTGYLAGLLGLNTQFYLGQRNILGLNGESVEGVFAVYKNKNNQAHLLLIQYTDSKEAKIKANLVENIFSKKYDNYRRVDYNLFKDSKNRYYAVMVKNNLLYITSRSTSSDLIKFILK